MTSRGISNLIFAYNFKNTFLFSSFCLILLFTCVFVFFFFFNLLKFLFTKSSWFRFWFFIWNLKSNLFLWLIFISIGMRHRLLFAFSFSTIYLFILILRHLSSSLIWRWLVSWWFSTWVCLSWGSRGLRSWNLLLLFISFSWIYF